MLSCSVFKLSKINGRDRVLSSVKLFVLDKEICNNCKLFRSLLNYFTLKVSEFLMEHPRTKTAPLQDFDTSKMKLISTPIVGDRLTMVILLKVLALKKDKHWSKV